MRSPPPSRVRRQGGLRVGVGQILVIVAWVVRDGGQSSQRLRFPTRR